MNLSPLKILVALIAITLVPLTSLGSGLVWEENTQEAAMTLGQDKVLTQFHFTNASDKSITITETKTTCGCTVPQLEKKTFEPGEAAGLDVLFDAKGKSGSYTKKIFVYTDEKEEKPYELTLKVDVPRAIQLNPRVQIWRKGSELDTKSYTIKFHDQYPVTLTRMVDRKDPEKAINGFKYEIETVRPKHEYKIHVTPLSTESKNQINLVGFSSDEDPEIADRLRSHLIYAMVR